MLGEMAPNLWYQSADIYSNYAALRRTDLGVERTSNLGVCGQLYLSRDRVEGDAYTVFGTDFDVGRLSTKRRGAQQGIRHGVQQHIGVAMSDQPEFERDLDAIQNVRRPTIRHEVNARNRK